MSENNPQWWRIMAFNMKMFFKGKDMKEEHNDLGFIDRWRKENGLDYVGWKTFLLKRWLRGNRLGFLVPFNFSQDDYDDGIQVLIVWRFGKRSTEKYRWSGLNHDIYYRLHDSHQFSKKEIYKAIQIFAKRIN